MDPQQKTANWEWNNPRIARKRNWIETLRLKISISIMNTRTEKSRFQHIKETKTLAMMNLMQDSTENTTSKFLIELKEALRDQWITDWRTLLN